ncbi:MAG TPA: disulfide bond formation protein B [Xanthobacteraceae bacterium]|jgi:disulfide bond formation protein DsbB
MSLAVRRTHPAAAAAFPVAIGGAATILGAYYFQYVLHYAPCELCLDERIPYYIGIPLALVVALAGLFRAPRPLLITGLTLLVVTMLIGAGLGIYHSGVEWKFWPGPAHCSGAISSFGNAGGLLEQMNQTKIVPCDAAAWRLFGISLAGYNALISLALAAIALWGIAASKAKA